MMKAGYHNDQWVASSKVYTIRDEYEWLRTKQPKQNLVQLAWNKWNYPKHAMISWLVLNHGLNVEAKLFQFGCCPDNRCCICDKDSESQEHLFFNCLYSKQVMMLVEQWCGFKVAVGSYASNGRSARTSLKRQVHYLIWTACFYHIWCQKKNSRVNLILLRPGKLAAIIKEDVMRRIRSKIGKIVSCNEKSWLQKWGIMGY
ncbi:uncharacterized protein LOC141655677 [Silene latifolia]|uniref:uncharacterized protein LOC141655677 n=1 Tax=Silene latifolia TaxID=37657 RepID=UPI003D77BFC9